MSMKELGLASPSQGYLKGSKIVARHVSHCRCFAQKLRLSETSETPYDSVPPVLRLHPRECPMEGPQCPLIVNPTHVNGQNAVDSLHHIMAVAQPALD
jgi:hypothetical protein